MKPIECERCGQMAEYSCNDEYLCDMHTREAIDGQVRELFVHNRTLSLSIIPIEQLDSTVSDVVATEPGTTGLLTALMDSIEVVQPNAFGIITCPYCGYMFPQREFHICNKRYKDLKR